MRGIAIVLGMLASLIGVLSAIFAFSAVGSDPAYSARLWAGWASLVLAILAGVAAIFMTTRPALVYRYGTGIDQYHNISLRGDERSKLKQNYHLRKRKLLNAEESIFFHTTRSIHFDAIARSMAQQRFPDWRFIGN